jgi:hypothetical protein
MGNNGLKLKDTDMNLDWLNFYDITSRIFVLILGTYVAYLKFFKGRSYKAKLSPSISCEIKESVDNTEKIVINASIANIGVYSVPIPKEGFIVNIATGEFKEGIEVAWAKWDIFSSFNMFEGQNRIEVGEVVSDSFFITLQRGQHKNIRFELVVQYDGHRSLLLPPDKGGAWYATSIVTIG